MCHEFRYPTSKEAALEDLCHGTWRPDVESLEIPLDQIIPVLPNLLGSATTGLIWPRIRHRVDEYGAVGEMLEHTYRQYLNAVRQIEKDIALVTSMLADSGIEAVLVKGWSLSRLYTPPQIRRPGDIDLIVPNGTREAAKRIIAHAYGDGLRTSVDLKSDDTWRSHPNSDFREHLEYVPCNGKMIPILGAADALRAVGLHFTKHFRGFLATSSPLWLCDIGALVERATFSIDWERVLGPDDIHRYWVTVALALARDVVGVDPAYLPPVVRDYDIPSWAQQALLKQWHDPLQSLRVEMYQHGVIGGLKRLWPNPLTATLACNAEISCEPMYRYQLWTYIRRVALYGMIDLPRHKIGDRLGRSVDTWLVDE